MAYSDTWCWWWGNTYSNVYSYEYSNTDVHSHTDVDSNATDNSVYTDTGSHCDAADNPGNSDRDHAVCRQRHLCRYADAVGMDDPHALIGAGRSGSTRAVRQHARDDDKRWIHGGKGIAQRRHLDKPHRE